MGRDQYSHLSEVMWPSSFDESLQTLLSRAQQKHGLLHTIVFLPHPVIKAQKDALVLKVPQTVWIDRLDPISPLFSARQDSQNRAKAMLAWISDEYDYPQTPKRAYYLSHRENCDPLILKADIQEWTRKPKILLHVCCGPDAAGVIDQLQEEFEVTCFWYDPNIQPKEEHDLRLEAFLKVCELKSVPAIVGEYDVDHFLQSIRGLEYTPEQGAKCSICYDLRLERSALECHRQGISHFTTTLAISPHKVQEKLKNFGELAGKKHQVTYVARNFMKHEGFKDSVQFTRTHNIFRQDYCGCWYSLHEGGTKARLTAKQLGLLPENQKIINRIV